MRFLVKQHFYVNSAFDKEKYNSGDVKKCSIYLVRKINIGKIKRNTAHRRTPKDKDVLTSLVAALITGSRFIKKLG